MAIVQIHHTAVNNALTRLKLGGKTFDAQGFRQLIAERLGPVLQFDTLWGDSTSLKEASHDLQGSMTFDERDPVRVRFQNGFLEFTLRASGMRLGEIKCPGHVICVRYRIDLERQVARLMRDEQFDVGRLEEPQGLMESALAPIMAKGVRQALGQNLFRPTFNMPITHDLRDAEGRRLSLRLARVTVADGWLSLIFR